MRPPLKLSVYLLTLSAGTLAIFLVLRAGPEPPPAPFKSLPTPYSTSPALVPASARQPPSRLAVPPSPRPSLPVFAGLSVLALLYTAGALKLRLSRPPRVRPPGLPASGRTRLAGVKGLLFAKRDPGSGV